MLAKRTWRGVLICVGDVSSVIILELEFYSNGRGIAVLRSSIGPGLADTVVKPRCSAGELRPPIFRLTVVGRKKSPPTISARTPQEHDLGYFDFNEFGTRVFRLAVRFFSCRWLFWISCWAKMVFVNAIELIDARYWNG